MGKGEVDIKLRFKHIPRAGEIATPAAVFLGWPTIFRAADAEAAPLIFNDLRPEKLPRLEVVWADGKYHNHELNQWLENFQPAWRLEIVARPPGVQGFTLLPKRWVAERTFAWNGRCRRHSKDYERRTDSSASMVRVTAISLMLRRLAPPPSQVEFHYQTAA